MWNWLFHHVVAESSPMCFGKHDTAHAHKKHLVWHKQDRKRKINQVPFDGLVEEVQIKSTSIAIIVVDQSFALSLHHDYFYKNKKTDAKRGLEPYLAHRANNMCRGFGGLPLLYAIQAELVCDKKEKLFHNVKVYGISILLTVLTATWGWVWNINTCFKAYWTCVHLLFFCHLDNEQMHKWVSKKKN